MGQFKYEPINLEGHSFRLLRLCKGDFGNVRCEIFNAYLNDKSLNKSEANKSLIEYEALSYTWGGSHKAHDIEVGDGMMAVTQNLSLALRSLRKSEEDRILWIDAVCIDQENDKEKSHQVHQMGLIYAQAARVLIWLGSSTLMTDLVFDEMSRFEKRVVRRKCGDLDVSDEQYQGVLSSVHILDGNGETQLTEDAEIGLEDLLSRPWFERAWIIQEVANAEYARVACGSKSVLAQTFALFPLLCRFTPSQHCQAILDVMPGPTRKHTWWERSHDLNTLLFKFRGCQASDPRDKIYALLGIASDRPTKELPAPGFPAPNYEKNEVAAVQDTIRYLLRLHTGIEESIYSPAWTLADFMQRLDQLANETCAQAAVDGSAATVKFLLDTRKADPNFKNTEEQTLLLRAAEEGHESIVHILLNTGKVDVNVQDKKRRTPLLQAAERGHESIVKLLLNTKKVVPDFKNMEGQTPMLLAAEKGYDSIVKMLLDTNTVDINVQDKEGQTPLLRAAEKGHGSIVKMLLDTNIVDIDVQDKEGQTPLLRATEKGHGSIVKLLLNTKKANLYSKATVLLDAAKRGASSTVRQLLDTDKAATYLDILDSRGSPALCSLVWSSLNIDVVKMLLDVPGINVNSKDRTRDQTALMRAAACGCTDIVKLLLETNRVDLSLKDKYGWTAFDHALEGGYWEVGQLLEMYLPEYPTISTRAITSTEQTTADAVDHTTTKTSTDQWIFKSDKETEGKSQSKAVTVTSEDDVESLVRGLEEYYASISAV
jgi:ankyrin repeat protein